jgi:uncharacterized protein
MFTTYDPGKRQKTLDERGLDMARVSQVFIGRTYSIEDDRFDYGELRWVTYGQLDGRTVVVVWTPRDETRRIISLRKANDIEDARYRSHL